MDKIKDFLITYRSEVRITVVVTVVIGAVMSVMSYMKLKNM